MAEPFAVPIGWRLSTRGEVLTAIRPGHPAARVEWRSGSSAAYEALVVEDEDRFELVGHAVAYRRLGHRSDGVEMVSEEWTWQLDSGPGVLTGTVAREDYLTVCDLFEDLAATVNVDAVSGRTPGPGPPGAGRW